MDYPIDERTSFLVKIPSRINDCLELDFDVRFDKDSDTGYIFRICSKNGDDGSGLCLFFDSMSDYYNFRTIWEGHRFLTNTDIHKSEIKEGEWLHVNFRVCPDEDAIYLKLGNYEAKGDIDLDYTRPCIYFGKSEYRIDVPSFSMKNLRTVVDGREVSFALNEDSGSLARSSSFKIRGKLDNPEWLMQDRFRWKKVASYSSYGFLTTGYDQAAHEVYLISRDSLRTVSLGRGGVHSFRTAGSNPLPTFLGTSFVSPRSDGYYCYEVFYGRNEEYNRSNGTPTAVFLDKTSLQWTPLSSQTLPMQMHHHGQSLDSENNRFLIYGGFGNRLYNGSFYSFSLDDNSWSGPVSIGGDKPWPRYFCSMGRDEKTGNLYLFGGMGNESGDQIVGRQYLYDFFRVDPDTMEAEKLWSLPWEGMNEVPVRSMILPGDGYFYTLLYPESLTNSELRLIRFSIEDGSKEVFADAIPINSDKILTNANVYFDPVLGQLVAIIEETRDDISSVVHIYTLSFPPAIQGLSTVAKQRLSLIAVLILCLAVLGTVVFFVVRGAKKRWRLRASIPVTALVSESPKPGSILMFGHFAAIDSDGNDISVAFTEKVRQLLYVILYEGEKNISSRRIRAILWPDKEEDKAKNILGVTMNKLRKALDRIGDVKVIFEDNHFILSSGDSFHCDYLEFFRLIRSESPDMDNLIRLLSRGKFLQGETDPMFDKMKEDVERRVSPIMAAEMHRRFELKEYQNAITCADILRDIDILDEDALAIKVRSLRILGKEEEARRCYQSFISDYKKDYDEEYKLAYEQIISL
ncbi:MAG: hypothetical protein K5984_01170 [Bacteroidales bacterium]|nr:hypothetical protein [Bacteroidales bacterium]